MNQTSDIAAQVYAAKDDNAAADDLIRQYLPFIQAETAKFTRRIPREGVDDELSIAMMAFHEAVLAYERTKGPFLAFAARVIRSRLIDHSRREQRHQGQLSLDMQAGPDDDRTLLEQLDRGQDPMAERTGRIAAREEILHFARTLAAYGLALTDIADNCPRQARTLSACHKALAYAKAHPELLLRLEETKKLPMAALCDGSGAERKTLERHRSYMMALLLAYTNGFEIIRGHLRQMSPQKGG